MHLHLSDNVDKVEKLAEEKLVHVEVVLPDGPCDVVHHLLSPVLGGVSVHEETVKALTLIIMNTSLHIDSFNSYP